MIISTFGWLFDIGSHLYTNETTMVLLFCFNEAEMTLNAALSNLMIPAYSILTLCIMIIEKKRNTLFDKVHT